MVTARRFADVGGLARIHVGLPPSPPEGRVVVPGSKSLTNRALLLAAVADGRSTLTGALDAEDTRLMVAALRRRGVTVAGDHDWTRLEVEGVGGPLRPGAGDGADEPLDVGTSGTVSRFLGAALAASPGVTATLDGTCRMRERPLGQLFDALVGQGAGIRCHDRDGFLPATIRGAALPGGEVVLDEPASSQIVSGMVFAAVLAEAPTRIVLRAGTPARPYVDMTMAVVRDFGGRARWVDEAVIEVTPGGLVGREYAIEPDATAATYAWALAAMHGGRVTVPGLSRSSLQGDVGFVDVLGSMGADVGFDDTGVRVEGTGLLRGVDVDLAAMPDPGVTLAALALRAEGRTRIRGVAVQRHHETDRIAACATELRRLGARVVEHDDGLDIDPPDQPVRGVVVDTYRDHRMAMAFALVGDVAIDDPGCVAKTWPAYFALLDRFGMVVG